MFFYIIGHGVDERLELELMRASCAFEPSEISKISLVFPDLRRDVL